MNSRHSSWKRIGILSTFVCCLFVTNGWSETVVCPEADLDGSCTVDLLDFYILASQWLAGPIYCTSGYEDCDGRYDNGCEIHTAGDVNHCGGCGIPCNLSHATPGCQNGDCVIDNCDSGWGNCDGTHGNGCETNLNSSLLHCGNCDNPCDFPHASESCQNGQCIFGACEAGWVNCNGFELDGCEVFLGHTTTCNNAEYIGTVCGDERKGTFCTSTNCQPGPSRIQRGSKWYKIFIDQCYSCSTFGDMAIWVRLQSPPNADYDLYLYTTCGPNPVASSTSGSSMDQTTFSWDNGSRWIYIEVRYYNGNGCGNWNLQTWGGCPSGP